MWLPWPKRESEAQRRSWHMLAIAATLFLVTSAHTARAEEVDVPVDLQVALATRVAAYDRNLPERAHGRVLIWVLVFPGSADSERVAGQLTAALNRVEFIAGIPTTVKAVEYVSAEKLIERCKHDRPTLVFLTAGLSKDVPRIATALQSIPLLSISTVPRYVDDGHAVLGIESRSGKASLVVHLALARKHQVAFKPELLRLARVIR